MANLLQWVNLEKKGKFVNDGITSEERLGALHFECEFKKAKLGRFKVRIVPWGNKNAKYSKEEKRRNPNFKLRRLPMQQSEGAKKTKLWQDVYLPAAGGDQYKIEAKYRKKKVESKKIIEARRRLFYEVITMKGVTCPGSFSKFEDAYKNEAKKYCIDLKEKGDGRNKMKYIKTVHKGLYTLFRNEARKAYSIYRYEDFAVAVVFSDYIATKAELEFIDEVDRDIPSKLFHWGDYDEEVVIDITKSDGSKAYMWDNLDPDDDKKKEWLVDAKFISEEGEELDIPNDHVTLTGPKKNTNGGYCQVKVKLTSLRRILSGIKGKINLKLKIAKGFSGGFSFTTLNLITVANRSWWKSSTNSESKIFQILNHEMGHKVGMVADGKGRSPDAPSNLYGEQRGVNDKGHKGPHCEKGCNYNNATKKWSGTPGCVMFGSTSCGGNDTPATFCDECGKVVRKLDLDGSKLPGLCNRF